MAKKKGKAIKNQAVEELPTLKAHVWQNLCDCIEFSMLHEMPDQGYYTVVAGGVKKDIPEKEGGSCSIEFAVSPGFLARLPFAPKDRAAEWEKSYEERIAAALAQFGGDAQKFARKWKPAFSDCGRLKIEFLVMDNYQNRMARLSATAIASDASGAEIGKYMVSGTGLDERISVLYFDDDDIEGIAYEISLNALSMDRAFADGMKDGQALLLFGLSIAFMRESSWGLTRLPIFREGTFLLLNPVSPLHVEGPMRQKVEAIVGTMEKPVFPQQDAVFLLRARQAGNGGCEIAITGPWAYREELFSAYPGLLARALEPGQNLVFCETYAPDFAEEDEEEKSIKRIEDGQELGRRIFKALGCPEED